MKLTVKSETASKITFTYDKPPGDVDGWLYFADGKQVSRSFDPTKLSVTFGKVASGKYAVEAVSFATVARAEWPEVLPPSTGPTAPANFSAGNITQTSVDLTWSPSTDDVGVVNYKIYRDGNLIGQGPGSSAGYPDAWKDSGLQPDTQYNYAVEAVDTDGNVGPRATVTARTLVADVPPPSSGNVIKVSGTIAAADLTAQIAGAPAGAVTVQPADGQTTYNVSGDIRLARDNVTFSKGKFANVVADGKGNGFVFDSCNIHAFGLRNVRDWTIKNCTCPFNGVGWNSPEFGPLGGSAMDSCKNWKILDSTFSGHYVANNPSQHTEAWYIGGGNDGGLIKGCTFDDGGTTGHLFWTWWYGSQTDQSTWPRNICVTACKFTRSHNPWFHTQIHGDIQNGNLNLRLDTGTCTFDSSASNPMGNQGGIVTKFLAPCTAA